MKKLWKPGLLSLSGGEQNGGRNYLVLAVIVFIGLLVRSYPLWMQSFPDPDFYYHLRMADTAFSEGGMPQYDALSYGGRPYTYFPFHHFAAAVFAKLAGVDAYASVAAVTLFVALASILFIYLLAKKLLGVEAALPAAFCAALAPGFVAKTTAFARPDEYALLLLPAAFLLAIESRKSANLLLFACLALIHLPAAFACFAIFALASLAGRIGWKEIVYAAAGLLFGAAYYAGMDWRQFLVSKSFASSVELASLDLVFLLFYSGVFIVFAGIGVWRLLGEIQRGENNLLLSWLALGTALVLAANRNVVFYAPPLALVAGAGLAEALRKSGKYAGAFIVFSLVLLGLTTHAFLENQKPGFTQNDGAAAEWLGGNSAGGLVAAHWDRGHFLSFHGSRVFVDGYFEFAPNPVERISLVEELLATPSEGRARQIVGENQIEFVFLDFESLAALSQDSVWKSKSLSGFRKAFENGAVVWRAE